MGGGRARPGGALRVVEHNGTGAIGDVDDAAGARGVPPALPGHLRHIHALPPEVSHQEAFPSQGKEEETQIRVQKWPGWPMEWEGCAGAHRPLSEEGSCPWRLVTAAAAGKAQG